MPRRDDERVSLTFSQISTGMRVFGMFYMVIFVYGLPTCLFLYLWTLVAPYVLRESRDWSRPACVGCDCHVLSNR